MKAAKAEPSILKIDLEAGFTFIELLIALTVTAVIGITMAINYASQEQAAADVREIAQMQQQLRGAMYVMEQDIRIAGWTPAGASGFGVTGIMRWSITDENIQPAPATGGSPSLTLVYDWDPNNGASDNNGLTDEPWPAYRLFDDNSDGILDLVRDNDNPALGLDRQLVAEGIEAIGFAYAFDDDNDGELDRTAAGNIIWAVDSDNNNSLDTNLDANNDGFLQLNDDTDGDFRIKPADGGGLATPVPLTSIRVVRIWLLARARNGSRNFANSGQSYLVGDQVVPNDAAGFTDNIRRRLLVRTVECRNLGI